jgi:hypothetical protein
MGSSESGEGMDSGRVNRAENTTRIWAQRKMNGHFADFDDDGPDPGHAIFTVESAGNIEEDDDDDFEQVSDAQHIHGIMSSGCGSGAGVVGFSRMHPIFAPGEELSDDDIEHTRSVGVFGKGIAGIVGQGDSRGEPLNSQKPVSFGAGVVGRGGKGLLGTAGVVGFSRGVEVEVDGPAETGVFGQGPTGVTGMGTSGLHDQPDGTGVLGMGRNGVQGVGAGGRGGIFESEQAAQVQLVPSKVQEGRERPASGSITATFPDLPKAGQLGDLMSVLDSLGQCTLWLCVSHDADRTARWARVLLGDLFDGTT